MNLKTIVLLLTASLNTAHGQVPVSSEGLIISLMSRIESLEKRVRFLEEQLMRQSNQSYVQSKKVAKPMVEMPKEEATTEAIVPASNYEGFFIRNVIQPTWRIKRIKCESDFPNNKVECSADFRVSGKVGRKARQVVKGIVLLKPNKEPLRVFKF